MNKGLLKNYVLRNNYYTQDISGYLVPRFIISEKGNKIDLEQFRIRQLRKQSSFSISFKYDLEVLIGKLKDMKSWFEWIPEFPIPVEDEELWKDCGGTGEQCFFVLDYFFPMAGVVVEIDSSFHDVRKEYDEARDKYLKEKYGLETLRYYNYGEEPEKRTEYFEEFKKHMTRKWKTWKALGISGRKVILDFSETGEHNLFHYQKGTLLFIDRLKRYYGKKWNGMSNVKVNMSELHTIDPKTFKRGVIYRPGDIEMMLLDNASEIMVGVYGRTLEICLVEKTPPQKP